MVDESGFYFDEANHAYWLGRERLVSVGEVLRDVGLSNMDHVPEYALQRGSVIHRSCHLATIGRLDWETLHDDLKPHVRSWLLLYEQLGRPEVLAIEQPIYHAAHRVAGTPDLIVRLGGYECIWDWKSNSVPLSTRYQTAAYDLILGGAPRKRAAIELQSDGSIAKMTHYDKPENRMDRDLFLAALAIFRAKRNHG